MGKALHFLHLAIVTATLSGCAPPVPQDPPPTEVAEPGAESNDPAATAEPIRTVEEFVAAYMEARLAGDARRAAALAGPAAEGAASLVAPGSGWELVGVEAIDANSFEVRVRIHPQEADRGSFEELLFVGPGAAADGVLRPWVVRGMQPIARPPQP